MKLYRLKTVFWGKDLDEEAILGYMLAEDDQVVYDFINEKFKCGEWLLNSCLSEEDVIAAKGDFNDDYLGEFYDQKFGWEDLGEISSDDATVLERHGLLNILTPD